MGERSSPVRGGGPSTPVDGGGGAIQATSFEEAPLHQPAAGPPPRGGEDIWTIRSALTVAAGRFGFSPTARLDAELLMAHALGVTREAMLLGRLDNPVPAAFAALVERRAAQEPVAYIIGTRGFWTIDVAVGPGVLVPRADSEVLIEAAVAHFGARAPVSVLDLGTGPGTLLLAALDQWPAAQGLGVERSDLALGYARRNAAAIAASAEGTGRARLVQGDWAAAIDARFDLVLANPPYIGRDEPLPDEVARHEPAEALFAGADGLDDYRTLAPQIARLVAPGGVAIVEIGSTQDEAVADLLRVAGFATRLVRDYGGRPRAIVATPA